MHRPLFIQLVAVATALSLLGCPDEQDLFDFDGDGVNDNEDCAPEDASIHPGAEDAHGNGVDEDCDGADGVDSDGDGYAGNASPETDDYDCNDSTADVHPGADDPWGDGVESNCDGVDGEDDDGDGFPGNAPTSSELHDCDDSNADIHPGAEEVDCDGLDNDCDGNTLDEPDADGDGVTTCDGDCDDTNAGIHPGADEGCDGLDSDCDGAESDEEVDDDGDGFTECDGDCDDTDDTIHPDTPELCDGLDTDCDDELPSDEVDDDGDGWMACEECDDTDSTLNHDDADSDGVTSCDGDCNDADADTYPGATELCGGLDNDCDVIITSGEMDLDGDGWRPCDGDCGSMDATVYPGAAELCDGQDNDCDGTIPADEDDADGDGSRLCDADCDDADATAYPGNTETPCDGVDNDCDAATIDESEDDGDGYSTCDGDCDDADAEVYPGAADPCGDGVDGDCDGVDPECAGCHLTVPADSGTIQGAIDLASGGETICVGSGTYPETIDLGGKAVHLRSTEGRFDTIIEGNGSGPVVTIDSGEGLDTVIEGFTVQGGLTSTPGAGIHVDGASPTLRDLAVWGNTTYGAGTVGGGIYLADSMGSLQGVWISDNEADGPSAVDGDGGGIYIVDSQITLDDVLLWSNTAGDDGAGLLALDSTVDLIHVAVVENATNGTDAHGGGIYLEGAADVTMLDVVVLANETTGSGGGLFVDAGSFATVTNAVFHGNDATLDGGAILATGSSLTLTNVDLSTNSCGGDGGAVRLTTGALATVTSTNAFDNAFPTYSDADDPSWIPFGMGGNLAVDPGFADVGDPAPLNWDLHLSATSDLIDAGDPQILDPDLTPSDIGAYGGPDATGWDMDGDGWPDWWQPGEYDPLAHLLSGFDCDDRDGEVHPEATEVAADGVDQDCDGRDGWFLDFGQATSYVDLGTPTDLDLAQVSIEAWIHLDSTTSGNVLTAPCVYSLKVYPEGAGSVVEAWMVAGTTRSQGTGSEIALGAWHHVAMTYDGNDLVTYLDGMVDKTVTVGPQSDTLCNLAGIGAETTSYPSVFDSFPGALSDIRLWDHARSQGEILDGMFEPLVGNEPGLVGWWLLDEGTDQWVYDSSLGGHDGTLGETPGVDAYDPVWAYQTD